MTEQATVEKRTIPTDSLPARPGPLYSGDGWDWIDALPEGWTAIGLWGRDGWNLGDWPYVITAHYNDPEAGVFGRATYVEGDVDVYAYPDRAARDEDTDRYALFYWRHLKHGPDVSKLPSADAPVSEIPDRYRGPFSW
ncbi:hypothetical protein [Streptomyces sp. NPDC002547]